MSARDGEGGPLTAAAAALEEELERFEGLVEALGRDPLSSQKVLELSARSLSEVADSDQRLGRLVQALVQEVAAVRDRQQAQARAVQARALEMQERTETLRQLLLRYEGLGTQAIELNATVQKIAAQRDAAATPDGARALGTGMEALEQQMGKTAEGARRLAEEAEAQRFGDVSRQADSLRQQLLAARDQIGMLRKGLGVA